MPRTTYGFIEEEGTKDSRYFHISALVNGAVPQVGARVSFERGVNPLRPGEKVADRVRVEDGSALRRVQGRPPRCHRPRKQGRPFLNGHARGVGWFLVQQSGDMQWHSSCRRIVKLKFSSQNLENFDFFDFFFNFNPFWLFYRKF